MHAYLIISNNPLLAYQKALDIAMLNKARLVSFPLVKIADVRELGQFTKLSQKEPIAFFIQRIEDASIDAVNAFLKQLEEPGKNTYFILTAISEDKVLPTIVSRCQVVRIKNIEAGIKDVNRHTGLDPVSAFSLTYFGGRSRIGVRDDKFVDQAIGLQFSVIDKIKKRDEAISFIQDVIRTMHHELISMNLNYERLTVNHLTVAQQALTALEKNGNVTSQLTRMVVWWNK